MSVEDIKEEIIEMLEAWTEARDQSNVGATRLLVESNVQGYIGASVEARVAAQVVDHIKALLDKFDEEFPRKC